jgi:ankyrin repeat protein
MKTSEQYQFECAAQSNNLETVKELYNHKNVTPSRNNNYALKGACQMGQFEVAKFLLENCDVDINDDYGWALAKSIKNNRVKVVELILSREELIFSSIHFINAVKYGNIEMVKLFLNYKDTIPNINNNRAFISAYTSNFHDITSLLWNIKSVQDTLKKQNIQMYNQYKTN